MRILQIPHGYPPEFVTGTERYVEALSRGLVEAGHRCFVLAGTVRRESCQGLVTVMQDGVAVTRVVSGSREIDHWTQYDNAEAEILIRGYLEMLRPDLVHVHHWLHLTGNLVAICKELGLPVVVTLHDAWATCARIHRVLNGETLCTKPPSETVCTPCVPRHPWHSDEEVASEITIRQEWVERELRLADRVITPSLAQKSLVERMLRLPEGRIQVVPLGTPSSMVVPHTARAPGYPERRLRMAYWGAIKPEKGVHVLLEAVRRLSDPSAVEVHLFGIIETPKYQQRLLELASGISVTFHDSYHSDDLAGVELDLAVVTSFYHESYSFVLDEAFQLGLAVIVSDRGALPERVGPGGLVFPAGDAAAVAQHIQALLDDPALLSMMKCAHAGQIVSMRKHLAQLSEVYCEVMSSVESRPIPASDHLERLARKHRQLSDREAFIRSLQYEEFVRRVQEVARAALPPDATVLVASRGDDNLLKLHGRRAWHFPRTEDGVYAGYYPADSAAAIAHLEALRAKGADYLILPATALWWLGHYGEFREHLERQYRISMNEKDTCLIFDLQQPKKVEILDVAVCEPKSDRILGCDLNYFIPRSQADVCTIDISGWVLGKEHRAIAVEVVYAGVEIRTVPISVARPDVAAHFPQAPGAIKSGFWTPVLLLGITSDFELLVQAVLQDESRVPLGVIRGRRQPFRSSFQPSLQPLVITSLGRTGTTWLMRVLVEHPRIIVHHVYPYETRAAVYLMQMLKVMSEPSGEFYMTDSPQLREWLGRVCLDQVAGFQSGIESFYKQIAGDQGRSDAVYFAEKHYPHHIPWMITELYPQSREIILVRDFRDMVCSILAFNAKRGYAAFGRERVKTDEEYIQQLRRDALHLLHGWKSRFARAHMVSCEDLILRPLKTLRVLLEYLGLDATPSMVEGMIQRASEEMAGLEQHRTIRDPKRSIGRWQSELNPSLRAVCQEAFGDILKEFGYTE